MKKLHSLIKACMTSDMNLFKIKAKKGKKSSIAVVLFITLCLMFTIWSNANILFEKLSPMHLQSVVLSFFVFLTSVLLIVEGIYKAGPLIFNCKDDQLLLSLPIKRRTVLFVRIFKFYIFELLFNSLFIIPLIIAYIRWAEVLDWTFFLTSFIMIFTLPIIPIIISCVIGAIIFGFSSHFKHKSIIQIVVSIVFLVVALYLSFTVQNIFNYIAENAETINNSITKIYYPAGIYASLAIKFNILDLLVFILINISLFSISIFVLSKFYFKINSRLKNVTTSKKTNIEDLKIKSNSITKALIKKELNTFLRTPVLIINSGFALVLFIIISIITVIKFDSLIPIISDQNGLNLSKDLIMNNLSIVILILISITSYMTSITNSLISLEGRSIVILKSLPIKVKTILMSKIYTCLLITTPVLVIGDIILFIKFKTNIFESILLIILSVLIPLVSHFIGLLINLKHPKLDAENSTEVVKQSTSSFISVMLGMILLVLSIGIVIKLATLMNSILVLVISVVIYILIDSILYWILTNKGVKEFNQLSI